MTTTVTIWIPKTDLKNFILLNKNIEYIETMVKQFPVTIYTEKMHIDCLQVNVSLDLFIKLNLK